MRRREFLGLLGGAAAAWPLAAHGQQPARRMRRLGLLLPNTPAITGRNPRMRAFFQELASLGWIDGQTIVVERRFAEGRLERLGELAADLVRANVDVIVTAAAPSAKAAKEATGAIPVVIIDPGDPVGTGLVQSLSRPGGNVTGVTSIAPDLAAKRLALLSEVAPSMTRVAVLFHAATPPAEIAMTELQAAAQKLNLQVSPVGVQRADGLVEAFAKIAEQRADGLLVFPDPLTFASQEEITKLAIARKTPTLFGAKEFVEVGGLMSYGPSYPSMFRRAAHFVDRILKGAKPSELPVEQPTRFDLVINLKTAKVIGLAISEAFLLRADEVIE
jgi:putative ABC transport system substrate-binding protein